ncbi:hypothetical protein RYX36_006049 [Vicia faba]
MIHELYVNALPIEGVRYTFCFFVRGTAVSFARDAISQYLGNPLTLQRVEICAYQKRVAIKKWKLDLVGETLALTPNHGFFLNALNQPVPFKRNILNGSTTPSLYKWNLTQDDNLIKQLLIEGRIRQ